SIQEYGCGTRSYDGHSGTDILLEPYYWKEKQDKSVWVVAAAAGIIVDKHDGEFDGQCDPPSSICGNEPDNRGNYVVILHDDGSTASLYMHMIKSSVTTKQEGDRVEAGEYLGIAGSSGCSNGPHLHFEVRTGYVDAGNGYENTGTLVDPFANGGCATSADSWWISEPPYTDPAVLTLETHNADPEDFTEGADWCDSTLLLYEDNSFSSGQTIWFRSKFRDWISGTTITENIYKPNGTLWHSFTRTGTFSNRGYIPLDQSYTVSALDNSGTYRYTVDFNGKTYSHYFSIACATDNTLSGAVTGHKGTMVSNQITSTQTISGVSTNYVKYMADARVILNPGFQAAAGCRFVANTEGCNNNTKSFDKEQTAVVANNAATNNAGKNANGLRIFPNPSSGIFTMQFSSNKIGDATVTIKNMMGQIVYALPQQKNILQLNRQINLSNMPKGIYIVEVNTGMERITEKVLIQ
ncbi:MAG TPA: peptidoglycan DD-metalloendopeptidase family protein, partial [Chitinophagaceae bacterium]|nr:peptidoglycan DD-metalloendopeptidase family protein [Chitinophagaceae bacterium]